jgi:rod shape-determining protein MreB
VAEHVKTAHGIDVAGPEIEDVIASLLRVGPHEERRREITGLGDGGERTVTVTSTEFLPCLDAHVRPIAAALDEVIAETPESLLEDIRSEGVVLCGGGARLEGLDRALEAASGIDVRVDGEPQLCAVRGTGYALDNFDVLKRNFMYIR